MFLVGFSFFISFSSNLSKSSIGTIIGLSNSSSISLLIFTSISFNSLSFNSVKSFSNSERLSLLLKIVTFAYYLSILSQYVRFYNLNVLSFSFLYICKKHVKKILKQKQIYLKQFKQFLSDFK